MKKGRRLHRRAVYASPERRQILWEKVIALVTQKRKPTQAQVRSVLPAKEYREYVGRLRTFKVEQMYDAVPEFIVSWKKQERLLRLKYHQARKKEWANTAKEIEILHLRIMEQFEEKLNETDMWYWIKTATGDDITGNLLQHSDIGLASDIRVKSLREMNRDMIGLVPDSAEREALQNYLLKLEREFGQTDSWKEVVEDMKQVKSFKNLFDKTRANYTFDLLSSLSLVTRPSIKQGMQGVRISQYGKQIIFGRVD